MLTGLCLICIVLFVDETYYNRRIPASEPPAPKSRVKRLLGIEQWHSRNQRSTFYQVFMRPWQVIAKPTVLLSMTYYMFTFAWVVGINTTLSIFLGPLYNFGLRQIGMSCFSVHSSKIPLNQSSQKASSTPLPSSLLLLVN